MPTFSERHACKEGVPRHEFRGFGYTRASHLRPQHQRHRRLRRDMRLAFEMDHLGPERDGPGKHLARSLLAGGAQYTAVPWFWSDQAEDKLQIAWLVIHEARHFIRTSTREGAFSVFSFTDRLGSVQSTNQATDHLIARRLLARSCDISPEHAMDTSFDLRGLLD